MHSIIFVLVVNIIQQLLLMYGIFQIKIFLTNVTFDLYHLFHIELPTNDLVRKNSSHVLCVSVDTDSMINPEGRMAKLNILVGIILLIVCLCFPGGTCHFCFWIWLRFSGPRTRQESQNGYLRKNNKFFPVV